MGASIAYAPKQSAKRRKVNIFNKFGHLVIGFAVGIMIAHNPVAFMSVIFGSLLPDIDSKSSTLGRYNLFVGFMKHRGHTHSIIGAMLISLPFALLGVEAYIMALIGSIAHIFGDKISSWFPGRSRFKLKVW